MLPSSTGRPTQRQARASAAQRYTVSRRYCQARKKHRATSAALPPLYAPCLPRWEPMGQALDCPIGPLCPILPRPTAAPRLAMRVKSAAASVPKGRQNPAGGVSRRYNGCPPPSPEGAEARQGPRDGPRGGTWARGFGGAAGSAQTLAPPRQARWGPIFIMRHASEERPGTRLLHGLRITHHELRIPSHASRSRTSLLLTGSRRWHRDPRYPWGGRRHACSR